LCHLLWWLLCLYWSVLTSWSHFWGSRILSRSVPSRPLIFWSPSWCDQSISSTSPSFVPIPLACSALFWRLHHHTRTSIN
jgi:hypothetical protein